MSKWTSKEVGHLKYILERSQSSSVHEMARLAHKKIKNRSVVAIGHKLRELISENTFTDNCVEHDGQAFPAEVVSGYIVITLPNGSKKPFHLYVWESHYGEIPTGYHVHHINGNRTDNRVQNLQLMIAADHIALHTSGTPPETAALFWFLQEKKLWEDYLVYREELLARIPLPDGH